ncbi:MAG: ATP-binding protein, partial [Cyanobacteria bacterium P01_A01_bin.135]
IWPDGSLHWLWGSAQFYPTAAPGARGGRLLGTVTDVTRLKQVRVDLEESEARLRRAVEQAPFPIFIHGEDGEILQMSQAVPDISGYAAEEISTIGDWTEKAYGKRQENVQESINQLYALDRRVDEGEFEIRTKAGESRTWLFSSAPLGQSSSGEKLVISMAADVTDRKQIEADLATRLRQQATVAELSQMALSGLELAALFNRATQMLSEGLAVDYCKVMELKPNQQSLLLCSGVGWQRGLVGRATVGIGHQSQAGYTLLCDGPIIVEDLRQENRFTGSTLLQEQGVISGMSTIIQSKDSQPFGVLEVHTTSQRQFTLDDVNFLQAVANLLATAIARKQSEQALEQLNITLEGRVQERTQALEEVNQELEAFSYSVAHDLRAPLRGIQGFAQVLEEDCGGALDELGREYIRRMAKSAETLDVLVQDLLTYSRLGRTEIELQCLSLNAVVKRVLKTLEPIAQAQRAQVEVAPMPHVYAQRTVLRQVMSNLLRNALKFTAPGKPPQVQIWAEVVTTADEDTDTKGSGANRVRVWVVDNGIGIAPQHQRRIFQPFERLHGVDTYSGTGIGLSIVKRGVQRMGGRVGVESAVGQGSGFWIELRQAAL